MNVNTLYVKKLTMNKAEIVFDSIEKALNWDVFLKDNNVQNTKTVYHKDGNTYFGFKMFRCRHQIPKIILQSNIVITFKGGR